MSLVMGYAIQGQGHITSPKNPRESQPHWYVSKFAELLRRVLPDSGDKPQGALL